MLTWNPRGTPRPVPLARPYLQPLAWHYIPRLWASQTAPSSQEIGRRRRRLGRA